MHIMRPKRWSRKWTWFLFEWRKRSTKTNGFDFMTTTIVYTPLHEMELDVARFSAFIVLTWMPWWRMCKRHPDVCRGSVLPKGATCTERWKMFLVFTSQLFLFRSYILSFAWRLARHADRSYDVCFGGDVCQCHDVVILQGKQNSLTNYHII